MAFYEFDGKRYDEKLFKMAKRYQKSGGRFSVKEATKMFNSLKDGGRYSDTEKRTVSFIRKNYKWSNAADQFFRTEMRRWAAIRGAKKAKRNNKKVIKATKRFTNKKTKTKTKTSPRRKRAA